jgi:hypothetical protein
MNINDLYALIPEEMHGSIAVSDGAVSITQDGDNPPFVMFKATTGDNPDPDAVPATELQPVDSVAMPKLSIFQRIVNFVTRKSE